jgi:parallel beta-helix repeat protein
MYFQLHWALCSEGEEHLVYSPCLAHQRVTGTTIRRRRIKMNNKRNGIRVALIFLLVFSAVAKHARAAQAASFQVNDVRGRANSDRSVASVADESVAKRNTRLNVSTAIVDCGSPVTVTAEADSWIDQNSASSNFALDGVLKIQSKAGGNSRALVRFALPAIPDGCLVGSAMLHLYAASAAMDRTLGALALASAWAEETVTWANQPTMTGPAAMTISDFQRRRWDVTSQVQIMYATGQNHGFLIRDMAEGGSGFEQQFMSRDSEDGPDLLIRFVSAVPADPAAPDTTITSAPLELNLDTSASFRFTGSDDSTLALDLEFQCRLNGQAEDDFVACASPANYADLSPGDYTFEVRAIDRDHKTDQTPAYFTWTILPPGGGSGEPVPMTVSCGQVLIVSTRVLNDLAECPEDGLIIGADGIIVNLAGHTIDGVGLGIGIRNEGFDSVTVRNGTVREFDYGLRLSSGTTLNVIEALSLLRNQVTGIELIDEGTYGNQIRNNLVSGNADGIALLDGTQATLVLENLLSNNSAVGLLLRASSGNLLGSNEIGVGSNAGVLLETASKNVLLGNVLQSAGDGGFLITAGSTSNRLRGNSVSGTSDAGFIVELSDANQLISNTVTGTGDSGIAIKDADNNLLIGNIAYDNSDSGIALDAANDNVLRGNDVRFNPGGLELQGSSRNLIEANNASFTSGNGIELGPESLENHVLLNAASGNSAQGIAVGEEAPEGLGNLIERNVANDNGGNGIYAAKGGSIVIANVANNNRGWGIYAGDTHVDGGGNVALSNAESMQCFNVLCNVIPTPTATLSPTSTASPEPTTATPTAVDEETEIPTSTPEPVTPSHTPTFTPNASSTPEPPTPTHTSTATDTPTATAVPPTATATSTSTPIPTHTHTSTATFTATATDTPQPTPTYTTTATFTVTASATATHTATSTNTPTATPLPPTAASTPTATLALPADLIFSDGFESGNLLAWSSSSTNAGDLRVSTAAALVGLQGLQARLDDNNPIFVTDDRPAAESRYRVRFYFDPNTIRMSNGNLHTLLHGYTGTTTLVLRIEFRYSNGAYQLRAGLRDDSSSWTNTPWSVITDASHVIELDWRASAGAGLNNGGLTLWIDEVQRGNITGANNDTRRIDRVRLGAVSGIDSGTRGTYYFDAFESRRATYIGP